MRQWTWVCVIVVLLGTVVFAGRYTFRAYYQAEALAEIKALGGNVVAAPRGPQWLRWCLGDRLLDDYPLAVFVDLYEPDHRTLQLLRALPDVKGLQIAGDNVTDESLDFLLDCRLLEVVVLSCPHLTDRGLAKLSNLHSLKELQIDSEAITDKGLEYIGGLENLEEMALFCPQITDEGMKHLRGLLKLRTLRVEGTGVTANGAAELRDALPNVEVNR